MAKTYDHKHVEQKWQQRWQKEKLYETPDEIEGKENYYALVEFAYPSGNLHVGHWYAYSVPDMYARFMRMRGYNVLFPFGFDAFGLPAENAAIQRGLNPRDWTRQNIDYMRRQVGSMGTMFDWSREVDTSDPAYYKWTQWLFIQLFKNDLAYQKETNVNWCPSCKTVLANEQVVGGHCGRCESDVEQRKMKQWSLAITKYADRLLDDLESLDWPEPIKEAQRQWIGKSEGASLSFPISNSKKEIEVFTTRPDTLFGATYVVLAPEHELVQELKEDIENWNEVHAYVQKSNKKTELERQENREKTGVELKGITALNPGTKEEIPVWIADYVLAGYGTGAIMAVPAHDARDFSFAKKYNLTIQPVVLSKGSVQKDWSIEKWADEWNDWYTNPGTLHNSRKFDGMESEEAKEAITKAVGGEIRTTYKLRDWGISRQRYWGCPIPIIHCSKCGMVADEALPVELPDVDDYVPAGDGKSPLAKVASFMKTTCPKCGGEAKRETDTMDTFMDSSWYFLRYIDPHNDKEFAARDKQDKWMPIDFYSGGAEHTTMHLLYSRFFHKALFDLGLVAESEPYVRRMNRGIILGPDGNKMSKSKGNVIDPDDVVERLGADTVRMYLAFIGPYNEVGAYPWSPDGIVGVRRFLERVWQGFNTPGIAEIPSPDKNKGILFNKTIRIVTESIRTLKMNTAIAALMKFVGTDGLHRDDEKEKKEVRKTFVKLLAPFAPHIAEELWREALGHATSIHLEAWPEYDAALVEDEEVTIAVQVNGKVRDEFTATRDISEQEAEERALGLANIQKYLAGRKPSRIIYVPEKIVSIVVNGLK